MTIFIIVVLQTCISTGYKNLVSNNRLRKTGLPIMIVNIDGFTSLG